MKTIPSITTCLLFMNLILTAQDVLTIGEIYDFDIGDEFHKRSRLNNQPPNADRSTILDKWYSGTLDTLWYKVYRDRYQAEINFDDNPPTLEYNFYKDTVTISVTNLDSSVFSLYPFFYYDSIANEIGQELYYDSIIEYSSALCGSVLNEVRYNIGYDLGYYNYVYGQGLGTVKEYSLPSGGLGYPSIDIIMFYYKKEGVECGTPDLRTGINSTSNNSTFSIYPNPIDDKINFNTSLVNITLEYSILDLTGREYRSGSINNVTHETFIISNLKSGIYIFLLKNGNTILGVQQLVKL